MSDRDTNHDPRRGVSPNGHDKSNGNGYSNGNGNGHGNGSHPSNAYPDVELIPQPLETMLDYPTGASDAFEQTEVLTNSPRQRKAVEQAIRDLLDAFNVNWEDPNYTDTPQRVAKAYLDYWASGYGRDPREEITVFPNNGGSDDMVMVKDMRFYSLCSHHLAPIEGYAAIAYIPDKQLLGLSKLGRILEIYARRFQLQERIGQQTADALMELLQPKGVMVVLYNVSHGCMSSRGVKLHEANTTTMTSRGVFKQDPSLRQEMMSLLSLKSG